MQGRRPDTEDWGMPPVTAPAQPSSVTYLSLRVRRGDDAAELQRRLEAVLLIARSVAPAVLPVAS
jgi:hypothetical protein